MRYEILTCPNHPTYRWTVVGRHLLFNGEEGGKPSCPFNMSEKTLAGHGPEYDAWYRERYTPECNCPGNELIHHSWTEE